MKYKFQKIQKAEILRNHLHMGGANPQGERIEVTSEYLEKAGKPWIGVMGEYHFSRADRADWYQELCKMKAGGITIVATYMFWIYHEEEEGSFDFTGDLDIRAFIQECDRAGLNVLLRIGPWAHGECRNGGFPDWLLQKPYELRDNNAEYMAQARKWYTHIYEQVKGLFYQEGGNIIGIQFENELTDRPEHLLALKQLALEIGFQAPLYTVTGWNRLLGAKIPVEEVLPVFGGYPEAPWEDSTERLPLSANYIFNSMRNDCAIGVDLIGKTEEDGWRLPYEKYPFATCELGGGMQATHHRRPLITAMDAYALALVKLGSGNNLPGYYMYHGGTHKLGKFSTLQESRASGYANDYPILTYDFQAPLSEYGEVREQYRLLNLQHLFLNDFGEWLAPMEYVEATESVTPENLTSLRYCMRTDGRSGLVFVNHYQRLARLEPVKNVELDTGSVCFPGMDIMGDQAFFMPFHMPVADTELAYAAAQPLCRMGNTWFFMEIEGVPAVYQFVDTLSITPEVGLTPGFTIGKARIVTLTREQASCARKLEGRLYIGKNCDLYWQEDTLQSVQDGDFSYVQWQEDHFEEGFVKREFHQAEISFTDLSTAPMEPDYLEELCLGGARTLTWKQIEVSTAEGMVEIPYACDVSQIYADGKLVADNYYYGAAWRVPAKLLYQKDCYLVFSELKDDFYKEF